jgi:hypothetical protein
MAAQRREARMIRWVAVTSLLGGALLGACATSGTAPRTFGGDAGPIRWEVVDIGQVVATDGSGFRWSYTLLLKNTGTSSIQFEQVERGSRARDVVGGSLGRTPFERNLGPGGETRASFVDTWGYKRDNALPFGGAAALETLTVERRFLGKDERGASVVVPVIMHFDRSVGKVSTARPRATPPPSEELRASDGARLAGTWQGYYRDRDGVFKVPVRIEVSPDGAFEAFENDPVTNRFRGRLRIQDGRVAWTQGADSGRWRSIKPVGGVS